MATLMPCKLVKFCAGQLTTGQQKPRGSKGDWVRSMALDSHDVLYVGTNAGRLQRVHLPHADRGEEHWEDLWDNGRAEPLVCVAVSFLSHSQVLYKRNRREIGVTYSAPMIWSLNNLCFVVQVTRHAGPDTSVQEDGGVLASQTLVVTGEQSGWATLLAVSSSPHSDAGTPGHTHSIPHASFW
jgi:hypothetical protein